MALVRMALRPRERAASTARLLLDFDWLRAKLEATEINALIGDFDYVQRNPQADFLQSALRLSAHVLAKNKSMLAGSFWREFPNRDDVA